MAARQRARKVKVGTEVEVDGRVWVVTWAKKECKLESEGETIWRHSRTVARLLEQREAVSA